MFFIFRVDLRVFVNVCGLYVCYSVEIYVCVYVVFVCLFCGVFICVRCLSFLCEWFLCVCVFRVRF